MRLKSSICAVVAAVVGVQPALAQTPAAPPPSPSGFRPPPPGDPCAAGNYEKDAYAPRPAFPQQTRAPKISSRSGYIVQSVASGLPHPRAIAFLPDGRMLVAERSGRLRLIDGAGRVSAPIAGVPAIPDTRGAGMMDVIVDPAFKHNRIIYFDYSVPKPGPAAEPPTFPGKVTGRIVKARLSAAGDRLEDSKVIYEGGYLRRLLAARDGTLMFTSVSGNGKSAQALETDEGKVLRIRTDGSLPPDNPFAGRADVHPGVYAYGLRDPDGIAQDPAGGVWTVEHGPRGGDELNRIEPGKNYGYAIISYGREYSGAPINNDLTAREGLEQPVYFWSPDIGPSGLLFYTGAAFPEWRGDVFVGGLVPRALVRLRLRNGRVIGEEHLLAGRCQRIRDVRQGPDGGLYVLTDEDNGEVLKLIPSRRRR